MADRVDEELLSSADNYMRQKLDGAPVEKLRGMQSDLERVIFKRLAFRLIRERVNVPATFFFGNEHGQEKPAVGLTWQAPDKSQLSVLAVHESPFSALRDLYHAVDQLLPAKELPCVPSPVTTTPEATAPARSPAPRAASVSDARLKRQAPRKSRSSASGKKATAKPVSSGSRKKSSTKTRKSSTRAKTPKAR